MQLYLWNAVSQLPSTFTTKWPIISIKCHTYRKFYTAQQPTQMVTTRTKWPWSIPQIIILLFSDSPDSFYPGCYKQRRCLCKKLRSKSRTNDHIKNCANITAKLLKSAHNFNITRFKLDEDILQRRFSFLNFIHSLLKQLSKFKQTCMLLMYYPYIRGGYFTDYSKQATWNLLHAYIYSHI